MSSAASSAAAVGASHPKVRRSESSSSSSSSSWAFHLAVSAVTLALVSAAVGVWCRRNATTTTTTTTSTTTSAPSQKDSESDTAERSSREDTLTTPTSEPRQQHNNGSIEVQFQHCANQIRARTTTARNNGGLDDVNVQLRLYGWYKQACCGDAPTQSSKGIGIGAVLFGGGVDRAKWHAWDRCRGTSRDQAMQHYITTVHKVLDGENGILAHSSDNDNSDFDSDNDGPLSGNAFAPRVSQPLHIDSGDDEDDEDDNEKDDNEKDESILDAPHRRSWHKQLLTAAARNDTSALHRLLDESTAAAAAAEAGADERLLDVINQTDASGQTALHLASDRGSVACVRVLLLHGANPCASDHDGISVLQAAVIAGHPTICRLLLECGANPDQPDADGDTPRSCASDDGSPELQTLFDDHDHDDDARG